MDVDDLEDCTPDELASETSVDQIAQDLRDREDKTQSSRRQYHSFSAENDLWRS
jgi:hypothetical protein